jgi:hypothetical protein
MHKPVEPALTTTTEVNEYFICKVLLTGQLGTNFPSAH